MYNKIMDGLRTIEKEEGVIILYACESGSRAWGFHSEDSDYDVRFFYLRPQEYYNTVFPFNYGNLTLDREHSSTIKGMISDDLDYVGHDVKKALYMISKGNPDIISWLYSPIKYVETDISACIQTQAEKFFNTMAGIYHYQHMAAGNFSQYIRNRDDKPVKLKKYLYVIRPLVCCLYIENYKKAPPMVFEECLEAVDIEIPMSVGIEIHELIDRKKKGEELGMGERNPIIDAFCEKLISYFKDKKVEVNKTGDWLELDRLFNLIIQTKGGIHGSYLLPCETR